MIFIFKDYQVSYEKWGEGPEILLAFHGFGQTASIFQNISSALEKKFTVYACSLFYHGDSKFPDHVNPGEPLKPEYLKQGLIEFCKQNQIDRFSLMGYSLGGRLVLKLVEMMPERINSVLLLAPDGVKKNRWYYFATNHFIGKRLFNRMVYKPKMLFRMINLFRALGIISDKLKKFVYSQYSDAENRRKIQNVWNTYSILTPRVRDVKAKIKKYNLKTLIFTGEYDPVLDRQIGHILSVGIEDQVKWIKMKAGHDLLKSVYVDQISAELSWLDSNER